MSDERIAAALLRLDRRDREILELSLRWRVPAQDLPQVLGSSTEVARRRLAAIDRLTHELQLQRGQDLGRVLIALLGPEVWTAAAGGRDGLNSSSDWPTDSRRVAGRARPV